MGRTVFFYLSNAKKMYQYKAKDSEIKKNSLCLGNISRGFSANNMKNTGLNGPVYDFSVDYKALDTSNIFDTQIFNKKT